MRPDLRAADDEVRASLASRRVALSAFLPSVGLGAGASTSWLSSNPSPFFGQLADQSRVWATLDLSMTLLDGGVRRARMSTADVVVREAELAREQLLDQVKLDVQVLLAQERAVRAALDAAVSAAESARRAAEVLALRYQTGAETLVSLTEARAAQVEAELERATTDSEVQRIRYQLAWATGELGG
jgi:outer membrane protein TolC